MNKAEEAALKAYPVDMRPLVYQDLIEQFGGKTEVDINTYPRCLFQEGYEEAEKDLILTWQDIKTIVEIADKMVEKDVNGQLPEVCETEEGYYKAILEEFNKTRK